MPTVPSHGKPVPTPHAPSEQQHCVPCTSAHNDLSAGAAAGGEQSQAGMGVPTPSRISLQAAPEASPMCPTPSLMLGSERAQKPEHSPRDKVGTSALW